MRYTPVIRKSIMVAFATMALATTIQTASAANWTGATDGDWWTGANWDTPFTSGDSAVFATGKLNPSITLDQFTTAGAVSVTGGNYTFDGGSFGLTATSLSINSGAKLTLQNIALAATPITNTGTLYLGTNTTHTGTITAEANSVISSDGTGNRSIGSIISVAGAGSGNKDQFMVTFGEAGKTGNITFASFIKTNGMTLYVNENTSFTSSTFNGGNASHFDIASGKTLDFGDLSMTVGGSGAGWSIYSGGTLAVGNTTRLGAAWGATISLANNSTLLLKPTALADKTGGTMNYYNSTITGAGNVTIDGSASGSVIFDKTNTYTGTTTILAGSLQLDDSGRIGAGALTISAGASLIINSSNSPTTTLSGVTVNEGTISIINAGGIIQVSGSVTGSGTVSLGKATVQANGLRGNATAEATIAGRVSLNMGASGGGLSDIYNLGATGDKKLTIGSLTGTYGNATNGFGIGDCTLNVLSDVTVTGEMAIASSTKAITIASGAIFEIGSLVAGNNTIGSGAELSFSGGTVVMHKVDMTNCVGTWGAPITLNGTALRFDANDASTNTQGLGINRLTNAITGSGKVEMIGIGSIFLSGLNTYAGGTTATSGTIIAGSASALGTGAVTFADGATLSVDGGVNLNIQKDASLHAVTLGSTSKLTLSGITNSISTISGIDPLGNTVSLNAGSTTLTGVATNVTFHVANAAEFTLGATFVGISGTAVTASVGDIVADNGAIINVMLTDAFFANFLATDEGGVLAPLTLAGLAITADHNVTINLFSEPGGDYVLGDTGTWTVTYLGTGGVVRLGTGGQGAPIIVNHYIPEPTTATLGVLGLAGLLLRRRRRA